MKLVGVTLCAALAWGAAPDMAWGQTVPSTPVPQAPPPPAPPAHDPDEPYTLPDAPPIQPEIFAPIYQPSGQPAGEPQTYQPVAPTFTPPSDAQLLAAMSPAQRLYLQKRARRAIRFSKASRILGWTIIGLSGAGLATSIALITHKTNDIWHDPLTMSVMGIAIADSILYSIDEPLRAVARDDAKVVHAAGIMSLQF